MNNHLLENMLSSLSMLLDIGIRISMNSLPVTRLVSIYVILIKFKKFIKIFICFLNIAILNISKLTLIGKKHVSQESFDCLNVFFLKNMKYNLNESFLYKYKI